MMKWIYKALKYASFAILLLLVIGYVCGKTGMGDFDGSKASQGSFVEIDGQSIRYIERGDGRDVLLIHGTPGSIEDMQPLFDSLAIDHHVVAYDRPGHGYSSAYDIPRDVGHNTQIARGIIDHFKMDSTLVIGHSYGGIISMDMATEGNDKVERFIILGSPLFTFELEFIYKLFDVPVLSTSLSWLVSGWYSGAKIEAELPRRFDAQSTIANSAFVDFRKELWAQPKVILSKSLESVHMQRDFERMIPNYTTLKNDVSIIIGESDVISYISDLKAAMPLDRVDVQFYPDVGHFVQMEALDKLLKEARK